MEIKCHQILTSVLNESKNNIILDGYKKAVEMCPLIDEMVNEFDVESLSVDFDSEGSGLIFGVESWNFGISRTEGESILAAASLSDGISFSVVGDSILMQFHIPSVLSATEGVAGNE